MVKVSPAEGADKLIRNAKNASRDIENAVNRVQTSPTAQAADKLQKMRQRWLEALDSGKVERGMRRVSLEEWKRAMIDKGIPRISQGLEGARDKIRAFNEEFYPYLDRVQEEVRAMPDDSLEDSIDRMAHNARRLHEFKRSR